jgi:fatty acid desaturase
MKRRSLGEVRAELARAGAFDPDTAASFAKLALAFAGFGALVVATVLAPWWAALALVPPAALLAVTGAMTGHDAGHGSFAGSALPNRIVYYLTFPLFSGLGVLHWRNKHNVLHHGHPNVAARDQDLQLWPMAVSSVDHAGSGRLRRWLQRNLQGYLFWPLTLTLAFVMRFDTLRHNIAHARRRGIDRAWVADVSCQLGHYVLWLVVPSLLFGVVPAVLFYVGLWSVAGVLLALYFTPAHIGMPIADDPEDGWLQQLEATRNLKLPRWMSWFLVGLDFQVEHHLFPRIPHRRLRAASEILRAWCLDNDLPYHEIGYGAALADVTRFMFVSWKLDPVRAGR